MLVEYIIDYCERLYNLGFEYYVSQDISGLFEDDGYMHVQFNPFKNRPDADMFLSQLPASDYNVIWFDNEVMESAAEGDDTTKYYIDTDVLS